MAVKWCQCVVPECDAIAELFGEYVERLPNQNAVLYYTVRCAMGHEEDVQADLVRLDTN